MKRICKYCGKEYDGDPGSTACPECAERVKKSVVRIRTCTVCGREFPGYPSSRYCPECGAERKREVNAKCKRMGPRRPLGSMDKCAVCGKEYVVKSGLQKYCPECAHEAIRAADRKKSIEWNRKNTTPERRKAERKIAAAEIECVVCGKKFVPTSRTTTCSDACRGLLAKRNYAEWENQNRDRRNQYQRERIKAKEAAMSPEEYRAYREKINKRWLENEKKRKLRQNENGGTNND